MAFHPCEVTAFVILGSGVFESGDLNRYILKVSL